MEQFIRIKKIGKGNFGDVLLVQRKVDCQVPIPTMLFLVICIEKDRNCGVGDS